MLKQNYKMYISLKPFGRRAFSGDQVFKVPNFINGKFEPSAASLWTNVIDPATQKVLSKVPQSTPEELKRAEVELGYVYIKSY